MSLFRPGAELMMGPITGIRPIDNRWGGEMPEEYIMAVYDDVMNEDLPKLLETLPRDTTEAEVVSMAVLQTIVRTGQRLAVELDGCMIDTTTIFDDDLMDDYHDEL